MSFGNPNITQAAGTSIGSTPQGPSPAGPVNTKTPLTGYTLINGTGNILQSNVPNDGQLHAVIVQQVKLVTANQTGGQIVVNFMLGGSFQGLAIDPGGSAIGQFSQQLSLICDPGTVITVKQNTAQTAGVAVWYGAITYES